MEKTIGYDRLRRILVVGPPPSHPGGLGVYTSLLATSLTRLLEVTFLAIDPPVPRAFYPYEIKQVPPSASHSMQASQVNELFLRQTSIRSWIRFLRFLRGVVFDGAIFEWWTASLSPTLLLIQLALRLRDSPLVLDIHEQHDSSESHRGLLGIIGRTALGMALRRSMGIVHSAPQKYQISSNLALDPDRLILIPLFLFDSYPVYEKEHARKLLGFGDDHLFLFFGTIRWYKGLDTLVAALDMLKNEFPGGFKVAIVGGAWKGETEPLRKTIESSSAASLIRLEIGFVEDERVGLYFSACDTVVLPYRSGSQSAVSKIALAFGKPVIMTAIGDAQELAEQYEGLHTIAPENPSGLAQTMSSIIREGSKVYAPPDGLRRDRLITRYVEVILKSASQGKSGFQGARLVSQ